MQEPDIYEQYALIENQITRGEEVKESLRLKIKEDMVARGATTEDRPFGKFSLATIKSWTYPESVVAKEKKIKEEIAELTATAKAAKEKSITTGEAVCEESQQLKFIVAKL